MNKAETQNSAPTEENLKIVTKLRLFGCLGIFVAICLAVSIGIFSEFSKHFVSQQAWEFEACPSLESEELQRLKAQVSQAANSSSSCQMSLLQLRQLVEHWCQESPYAGKSSKIKLKQDENANILEITVSLQVAEDTHYIFSFMKDHYLNLIVKLQSQLPKDSADPAKAWRSTAQLQQLGIQIGESEFVWLDDPKNWEAYKTQFNSFFPKLAELVFKVKQMDWQADNVQLHF